MRGTRLAEGAQILTPELQHGLLFASGSGVRCVLESGLVTGHGGMSPAGNTVCLLSEDMSQYGQAPETYVPGSLCPLGQVVLFLPSALSFPRRTSLTCQTLGVKL